MKTLESFQHIHIVGIGGAGMSAIARVLHGRGYHIQGSDRRTSPLSQALQAEGMTVFEGHDPDNLKNAELVLASSAVPDDNVELLAAQKQNIPVMRRPDFLADLTAGYEVIAVAGTHGKTTVTGMVTLMLLDAGLDPTYIIGGVVKNLGTNAHAGQGKHFIIEADEYRNTFLTLTPQIAIITNVEFDHPDCFAGPRFVRLSFGEFADNILDQGLLIICNDDKIAHAIAASYHANGGDLALYGLNPGVGLMWQARDIQLNEAGGMTFLALNDEVPMGLIELKVPGEFNVNNALAALCVSSKLGIDWATARAALERFEGTARRFEILGEAGSVLVIDDYAHHPTQIQAVLSAAGKRYPERRIIAAWEPHTFSRVRVLHDEFMGAFWEADEVVVLPIYAARETDDGSITPQGLASEIAHPQVSAATTQEQAIQLLAKRCEPGDVVMMMGAGNEYIIGQKLLKQLQEKH